MVNAKEYSYITLINEIKSDKNNDEYRPLTKPEEKQMILDTPNRDELNQKLIKHNITLVTKEVNKYRNQVDVDDLFQNGMIGLVIASERFDITATNRFSTFAYWYIKKYVYNSYDHANKQFDGKTNGMVQSMDAPLKNSGDGDDGGTFGNIVDDKIIIELPNTSPYKRMVDIDATEICSKLFTDLKKHGILSEKESFVLENRYLNGFSNGVIAKELNVSKTYISLLHKNMITKLKTFMSNQYGISNLEEILYA